MASIPGVSVMAALLAAAGLDAALGSQPATVFAPTDGALLDGAAAAGFAVPALAGNAHGLEDFVRCAFPICTSRRRDCDQGS